MTVPPASRWSSRSEPVPVPKWITGTRRVEPGEEPRHVRLDEAAVVGGPSVPTQLSKIWSAWAPAVDLGVQVERGRVDQDRPSGRPRPRGRGT